MQDLFYVLGKCGYKFFVKYYYELKDVEHVDRVDLAERALKENPSATSIQSQIDRVKKGRQIFREHRELDALKIIIHSEGTDPTVVEIAKGLYEECLKAEAISNGDVQLN